ncbi:MAG TPA: PilZ domain-containing protein [Candidatus Sulfotelmatobacter sp.]
MTTPAVQVERRGGQRFPFLLPVSVRDVASGIEGLGFTQDISSRGVFFFTEMPLSEGAPVELTLNMPSEITLGDNMRVRCRAHILRVVRPAAKGFMPQESAVRGQSQSSAETKIGVAVRLEGYEYLPDAAESVPAFPRISALHAQHDEDRPGAVPRRPEL